MSTFHGVCGSGEIARDPWDPAGWSGSSARFFQACRTRGLLSEAIGVEVPRPLRYLLMARSFSPDRAVWRQRFYLDVRYRERLSRRIARALRSLPPADVLQLGAMYDSSPAVRQGFRAFSYHDGNLACLVASPSFSKSVPRATVDRAMAYERDVAGRMDRIFTMSEYLRRSFVDDYGVDAGRVVNIGAGMNLSRLPELDPAKDYSRAEILFVGVDFVRKGGEDLLRAFRVVRGRHPHARLHIVGPRGAPPSGAAQPGVEWHGFLDKGDPADAARLEALFRDATLFVMPSLYEPFGIAPLEAMCHGIPALVSDRWALPEIVVAGRHGENVPPGDWEQLAETVDKLLGDPARLEAYGRQGRRHALENFTWDRVAERLAQALESGPDRTSPC